jgi:hypothetical protein
MVYVPRVFGFRIHRESKREQVSTSRQQAALALEASKPAARATVEPVEPEAAGAVDGAEAALRRMTVGDAEAKPPADE